MMAEVFFTGEANYKFADRRLFTGVKSPGGGLLPVNRRGRLFRGAIWQRDTGVVIGGDVVVE